MKQTSIHAAAWLCLAGAVLASAQVQARPVQAGTLSEIKGQVQIRHEGKLSAAANGAEIDAGDTIEVGSNSAATLNTLDKAVFALVENSELKVDQYSYQPGGRSMAHYLLGRGALRTTSGLIGKRAGDDYLVTSSEADVRIHGTDYQLAKLAGGGLTATVFGGTISVTNDTGTVDLGAGQAIFVPDRKSHLVARLLRELDPITSPPIIIHISVS